MEHVTHNVGLGEFLVFCEHEIINVIGIGSCICLILYDKAHKIGGLAHIMLPKAPSNNTVEKKGKYADTAIHEILLKMKDMGADIKNIKAKVIGGANMFPQISSEILGTIGTKNYEAVKNELNKRNIKIIAQDIGGNAGRTVFFDTSDGSVKVKIKEREETM
jgi:chemotaxis protein CheD